MQLQHNERAAERLPEEDRTVAYSRIAQAPLTVKREANAMMRASTNAQPERLPYFCECDDPACLRAVWLTPEEYDRRKADPAPLLADDHPFPLARVS